LLGGRYRLTRPIGSGGMGTVYAAIDERLGGEVALKLLRQRASASLLERFRREARLTATLGNPHIVRITDFHENPGEPPFIVMERIDGMSLRALIETAGPLPPRRACAIAAQILSALGDAHAAGILHRDVKPANVIVSSSPAGDLVKVVDFGLARLDEAKIFHDTPTSFMQLTAAGELVGTAGYVAPEHLRGEPIDGRADIYAVGATLFQMLSGKKAFDGMSLPYWMATAQRSSPRLDEVAHGIDPALVEVVARAMSVRQEERYASAPDMIAALAPWTTDSVTPHRIHTPVPPDSWIRATQVMDPSDMEKTLPMSRFEHSRPATRPPQRQRKRASSVGPAVLMGLVIMLAAISFLVWKLRLAHEQGPLRGHAKIMAPASRR
jgi:serine/threonine protein kinase